LTVKIKKIINECYNVKTFFFNIKEVNVKNYIHPKPGQFVMVWVPGVDEVPMSLSSFDKKGNWSITVKNVGKCTDALHKLKINDYIGIRGPLGTYFHVSKGKSQIIYLIGGSIGMAPLKCLSTVLVESNLNFNIIEGAKIHQDLLYKEYFNPQIESFSKVIYCTDDGSYGIKGIVSEVFEQELKKFTEKDLRRIIVYCCGPELMLYEIFRLSDKYNFEFYASLERMMRCGCGLCGLCSLDPLGLLVCKDGPIFSRETLNQIGEFGNYKRDSMGRKVPFN
jgi:dihydroorotate dehydrogenase electron transfer subunit